MVDFRKWLMAFAAAALLFGMGSANPASANVPSPRPDLGTIQQPADLNANPSATLIQPQNLQEEANPEDIVAENLPLADGKILSCNLLFPFVSNQAGFDTGIALMIGVPTDPAGTDPLQFTPQFADPVVSPITTAKTIIDPDVGRRDQPFQWINRRNRQPS
jgi:hypothetical protein